MPVTLVRKAITMFGGNTPGRASREVVFSTAHVGGGTEGGSVSRSVPSDANRCLFDMII